MQIKSIFAAATIALIAGVGSVSADERSVAATEGDTGTPFALLNGIATEQMSIQELAATRGAAGLLYTYKMEYVLDDAAWDWGSATYPLKVDSDGDWIR